MKTCPSCRTEAPDDAGACGSCGKLFEPLGAVSGPPDASAASTNGPAPEPTAKDGTAAAQENGLTACPQCKTAWQPGAVVCMTCGYDARIGRRLATVHGKEEEAPIERPTAGAGPVRMGLTLHAVRAGLLLITILVALLVAILTVQVQNAEDFAPQGVKVPEANQPPPEPGQNTAPVPPVETVPAGPDYTPVVAALVLALIALALALAQPVLGIAGSIRCLWTPRQAKVRPWIVASLACDGLAFLGAAGVLAWACWQLTSLQLDPSKPPGATDLAAWPLRLASLPVVAAWVLFMVFAGKTAAFYEQKDEASQTMGVVISGLIAWLAFPLIVFPLLIENITWLARDLIGALMAYILTAAFGIGWFAFGIWIVYQVFGLTNAVRRALGAKPSEAVAPPVEESKE